MGTFKTRRTRPDASFQGVQCPKCKSTTMELGESLVLESLKRADAASWLVGGQVQLLRCMHGRCCNCGMVLDAIQQAVPVRFDTLSCPRCRKSKHLRCEINELELRNGAYRFSVSLNCAACKWMRRCGKLLKGLWSITRVKISIAGIELEKGQASA